MYMYVCPSAILLQASTVALDVSGPAGAYRVALLLILVASASAGIDSE